MKAPLVLATLGALGLVGSPAFAQELGAKNDVSFAADRLMGFYLYDEGNDFSAFGLGAPPPAGGWYTTPRFAIDFFPIANLSLGAAFAYVSVSDDNDGPNDREANGFLFSPRVGYALDIGSSFGFWPRGGLTFRDWHDDSEIALTLEGMFWAAPAPHFAFTFGPAFDIGISGDG